MSFLILLFELQISGKGHSRVPVYEGDKENIVGLLFVKSLIMLDPDEATPIKDVYKAGSFLCSSTTEPLFDLLDKFQTGKSMYVPLVFDFVSGYDSKAYKIWESWGELWGKDYSGQQVPFKGYPMWKKPKIKSRMWLFFKSS